MSPDDFLDANLTDRPNTECVPVRDCYVAFLQAGGNPAAEPYPSFVQAVKRHEGVHFFTNPSGSFPVLVARGLRARYKTTPSPTPTPGYYQSSLTGHSRGG